LFSLCLRALQRNWCTKLKYLPVEGFFAIFVLLFQGTYLVSSVYVTPIHTTPLQVFEFQRENEILNVNN